MARTFLLFLFVLLLTQTALAQHAPAWEIFGGYSLERSAVRTYYKSTPIIYTFRETWVNLNGWELSVTENITKRFGGTLQLSGHYKSPVVLGTRNRERMFSIMYGPRIAQRMSWGTPYGQVLFGAGRTTVTVSPGPHASETAFTVAAGAGFDLNLGEKVAARVIQVQYSPMTQVATKNHKFQASAGLVFYLGTTNR